MFSLIVAFSAFFIAGCAAFFSVQGLASLYAGQFISVCIMAGSLEIGKLIASSYLHRYWNKTNFILKFYLILAILSLMSITSLGIFGFLTSAFQQSHVKIEIIQIKKNGLESKKQSYENEINSFSKRLETLNQIRIVQEQRVQDAGNYKLPREQAYEAISQANKEIQENQEKIKSSNEELKTINEELLHLKTEESKSTDIGTLKFVAELFNLDIQTIVKWFTIIIVFVFDPLAISLILAYNNIVSNKNIISTKNQDNKQNDVFKKILNTLNIKYKDK
jgi:hypothetical protein